MRVFLMFFFIGSLSLTAQLVTFTAEIGDSTFYLLEGSKRVSKLTFYISDLQLETMDGEFLEVTAYHLIDFKDSNSLKIETGNEDKREIKSIHFKLGIDSATNVSGAFGGVLDPTKGMYWRWQSGYINFKIEGTVQDEKYTLHLGGYSFPFKSVQQVILPVKAQSDEFIITLPIDEIIEKLIPIDNTVMSPSLDAVSMSKSIASFFYLK
tara:strand:- start:22971 stop:23597 length:627 start_codon:yes stop_codon:yes gene_type:complete